MWTISLWCTGGGYASFYGYSMAQESLFGVWRYFGLQIEELGPSILLSFVLCPLSCSRLVGIAIAFSPYFTLGN